MKHQNLLISGHDNLITVKLLYKFYSIENDLFLHHHEQLAEIIIHLINELVTTAYI